MWSLHTLKNIYSYSTQYLYNPLIILLALTSIYTAFKGKEQSYFFAFIISVIFMEIGLEYYPFYTIKIQIHNLFIIFYFLFFTYFVLKFNRVNSKIKKISSLFSGLFFVYIIVDILAFNNEISNKYLISNFMLVSVVLIILELIYYISLINSTFLISLNNNFSFWIISGNIFWNSFFILRMGILYYFNLNDDYFYYLSSVIFTFVNIITYSIYLKGLTCLHFQKK
jgi:hypothetical protein